MESVDGAGHGVESAVFLSHKNHTCYPLVQVCLGKAFYIILKSKGKRKTIHGKKNIQLQLQIQPYQQESLLLNIKVNIKVFFYLTRCSPADQRRLYLISSKNVCKLANIRPGY